MQRGFLQALFTADGQVNDSGEKGCSARLSSSHLALLQDVQRLLSTSVSPVVFTKTGAWVDTGICPMAKVERRNIFTSHNTI